VATPTIGIPAVPFATIQGRMDEQWDPFERNSHQVIFGTSGSGKSHLIRYGILPVRPWARTVIIDMKGNRSRIWADCGTPVIELPREFGRERDGDGPADARYRLVVDRTDGKAQVRNALARIRDEGHCVVVVDESRAITEREQLNLGSDLENLVLLGRELGITLIIGAQSTAYAVPSIKDQPAVFWIGQQRNTEAARELAKVAGYGRELVPVIGDIPARSWLYGDNWGDKTLLAISTIT
jgi:hypothetical protein